MSLKERLADFAGALTSATYAPDRYPLPEYVNFESNMSDLRQLWSEIRLKLTRDQDEVAIIDKKMQQMFEAFYAGRNKEGLAAVFEIYNMDVERLR